MARTENATTSQKTAVKPKSGSYHKQREYAVVDEKLQHRRFGGFHFDAAFFGWLVSTAMGTILITIVAAAGTAVAVTSPIHNQTVSTSTAATVGLVGGVLLLVVLALAYYSGGYVAGRMVRFDGARQGFGVWALGIIMIIILGGAGALIGAKYNVLQQLNLPHIPVKQERFTTGGLVTTIATLVVSLVAAVTGGKVGEHYHRKIDAQGTVKQTVG